MSIVNDVLKQQKSKKKQFPPAQVDQNRKGISYLAMAATH